MAEIAIDKAPSTGSFVTLACPSCECEVDIYIASAPVVGAWCACDNKANKAMKITYERQWNGSFEDRVEPDRPDGRIRVSRSGFGTDYEKCEGDDPTSMR